MFNFDFKFKKTKNNSIIENNRFIRLSCNKMKTEYDNINLLNKTNLFPCLSIPSGSKVMISNTPWSLIIMPNSKARNIIKERFYSKYKNLIIIKEYEINNEFYLFVILISVIPYIYSIITNQEIIRKDFELIDNLYIGGFMSDDISLITNLDNINNYILLPKELKDLKLAEVKETYLKPTIKKFNTELKNNNFYKEINLDNNITSLTFTDKQSKLIKNIIDNYEIEYDDLSNIYQLFIKFMNYYKKGIDISLINKDGITYKIEDIIKKIELKINK